VIFVTVGTQLPFDRLVRAVDEWAQRNSEHDVLAQIGPSDFRPKTIQWVDLLTPEETSQRIREAEAIVSHAGIGSIIAALQQRKPVIVLPRRAALGEHRSDHQLATARRFAERGLVHVAQDEEALSGMLDSLYTITARVQLERDASARLTAFLADFLKKC